MQATGWWQPLVEIDLPISSVLPNPLPNSGCLSLDVIGRHDSVIVMVDEVMVKE